MENNFDYNIYFLSKRADIHSKVYIIQEKNSRNELIVKIYEKYRHKFYQDEIDILDYLNTNFTFPENNFFIMYKNINYYPNMFKIPEEVIKDHLKYSFFDYLQNLSLIEYLESIHKWKIKEIHAKFLCYKLLIIIQKLRKININHNKINTSNIMFDDAFNIKLIDFCEAKRIVNNIDAYKLNKDLYQLAKIIIKILSFGKIKSINFGKKTKKYLIKPNSNVEHKEESLFFEQIRIQDNIIISKQALDFIHILIDAKKEKKFADINDLLKNEWLNEIRNNEQIHYNIFREDFTNLYNLIIDGNKKENTIDVNSNDMFDIDNEAFSAKNIIKSDYIAKEKSESGNVKGIENAKLPPLSHLQKIKLKPQKNIIHLKPDLNKKIINEKYPNDSKKQIENEFSFSSQIQQNNNIGKSILRTPNKGSTNIINNPSECGNNIFIPRKNDFNYLEINIKNEENKDINTALFNFMKVFKNNIKEYYIIEKINVNFENIDDKSFKICYEIPPSYFDDEIEFLDEEYEQKVKNLQKFEIKVEVLEGIKKENLFINQYYLIFNGISIDKEDFYEHLNILKKISKNILIKE